MIVTNKIKPFVSNLRHDHGPTVSSQLRLNHVGDQLHKVAHVLLPLRIGVPEQNAVNPVQPYR